ncbi:hypothetical protein [Pseudomonas violetae]|jgi:hypothetical protein|uniref:Uncharacterized protein n=1 Tax=Pseudomonas violetae TaxID=2915813 RepID=A0ABT0F0A6_9PSED|nr:hypothetical protein [Pseudomonas violetae]MCK1791436.1 hypothetical protein [Pseudomonas violetae]
MSWFNCTKASAKRMLIVGLLSNSVTPLATAAVQEITAVFRPDSSNPQKNIFENTTPQSGICPGHIPQRCEALNIFSIRTLDITFESNRSIPAGHESEREGAMFKVPSAWRDLTVVHSETGAVETVQMRIAGIGGRWDTSRPPGVTAFGPQAANWGGAPAPCVPSGYIAAATSYLLWFWIVPEGAGACSRTAQLDIPWLKYTTFEYAYELKTPNPLGMSTGQYTGSIVFGIGPGEDFDFGDTMIPNDNNLIFNFTLDVQHTLKVEIPPGGNRVELVPQGGWQAWLTQGRKPTRLFSDQTFNVSSSTRFKMNLDCQYSTDGNRCSVRDSVFGHVVPLDVSVTLPNGLVDASAQPVTRRPLRRDGIGTELFLPSFYVDRKPGTLHFEIAQDEVGEMLKPGIGRSYSGSVTVIWDSEAG